MSYELCITSNIGQFCELFSELVLSEIADIFLLWGIGKATDVNLIFVIVQ